MTTQTEALTLALEALEANQPVNYCMNNNGEKFPMMQEDPFKFERNTKAITAIKEALANHIPDATKMVAQTKQEPVAWMKEGWGPDCGPYIEFYRDDEMGWRDRKEWTPLYTTPPQRTWVGLSDEEIYKAGEGAWYMDKLDEIIYAKNIEAKLKEKNT